MKKALAMFAVIAATACPLMAQAAPETMPDGTTFDAEYYAASNPDVAAALGTDATALYQHYTQFGKNEGRKPCADAAGNVVVLPDGTAFDPVFYASTYPDIAAALGTDANLLAQHYMQCGKAEGRLPAAGSAAVAAPTTPAPAPEMTASAFDYIATYLGLVVHGDNPAYVHMVNAAKGMVNAREVVVKKPVSEEVIDEIVTRDGSVAICISVVYESSITTDPDITHYPLHIEAVIDGNRYDRYVAYGPEMMQWEAAEKFGIANIVSKTPDFPARIVQPIDSSANLMLVYTDGLGMVNVLAQPGAANLIEGQAVMVHVDHMSTQAEMDATIVDPHFVGTLTPIR